MTEEQSRWVNQSSLSHGLGVDIVNEDEGLPASCRSEGWQMGIWLVGLLAKKVLQFYWLGWFENPPGWCSVTWYLESCVLFSRWKWEERGMSCSLFSPSSTPPSPLHTSSSPFTMAHHSSAEVYQKLWRASLNMSLVHTHDSPICFRMKHWWKPKTWSLSACNKTQRAQSQRLVIIIMSDYNYQWHTKARFRTVGSFWAT